MTVYLGNEDQRDNKRNGHKKKKYTIKGIGTIDIKMPQARKKGFNSCIIPKGEVIDPRIKEDLAFLTLAGLSTRTMALMSKRILGIDVSKETVANSFELIKEQALEWLQRPITEEYWALFVDGTNFNIRRRDSVEKEPSLVVLGIDKNDHRSILAIEQGYKDSAETWRTVFRGLKERGLDYKSVQVGIMDGLPGLENVFREEFPYSKTARCWVHALTNALNKTPKRLRDAFSMLIKKVMYASSRSDAESAFKFLKSSMNTDAVRAVSCIEKDLESLLVHYDFDKSYWRVLRTTNAIERINKELKRRYKSMEVIGEHTLRCLVVFTALKMEMNWKNTKVNASNHNNLRNRNTISATIIELTKQTPQ